MPAITNIIKRYQPQFSILSIRKLVREYDLETAFRDSTAKVNQYMNGNDVTMIDVPFIIYHDYLFLNSSFIDVEFCYPVDHICSPSGEIRTRQIEAGNTIFTMYTGQYNRISEVYAHMTEWLIENGYEPAEYAYEYFFNETDIAPSELVVKVVIPYK